jgi:hypothetical protein
MVLSKSYWNDQTEEDEREMAYSTYGGHREGIHNFNEIT